MPPRNPDQQIRSSRKNRDTARNEQQKNVPLTEMVKAKIVKWGELSRESAKLQADSDVLIRKSRNLRGRHTFGKQTR